MQISEQDITKILELAPCATVAMYSGRSSQGGQLTIIASNGHRADDNAIGATRRQVGLSNIVDGPALKWLAQQSQPRIWVSDACVSGAGEAFSMLLLTEALATAKDGNITRYGNLERAIGAFEQIASGRKTKGDAAPTEYATGSVS